MTGWSAIARNELRQLRRSPTIVGFLILMPLGMMTFVRGTNRFVLASQGYDDANGAEQAVPGLTVMFVFFGVGFVSNMFFREHHWQTGTASAPARPQPSGSSSARACRTCSSA